MNHDPCLMCARQVLAHVRIIYEWSDYVKSCGAVASLDSMMCQDILLPKHMHTDAITLTYTESVYGKWILNTRSYRPSESDTFLSPSCWSSWLAGSRNNGSWLWAKPSVRCQNRTITSMQHITSPVFCMLESVKDLMQTIPVHSAASLITQQHHLSLWILFQQHQLFISGEVSLRKCSIIQSEYSICVSIAYIFLGSSQKH